MSEIKHINQEDFEELIANNKLVLIDFFATWCPPCKMLAPVLEEVQKTLNDKIVIAKINVDENEEISRKFRIMSIPTMVLFQDGKQMQIEVGYKDFDAVMDFLKGYID